MATFPGAVADRTRLPIAGNQDSTVLLAAISSATRPVVFTVPSGHGARFVVNQVVCIDSEQLLITAIAGDSITASNFSGTAATHPVNALVEDRPTASHWNNAMEEIIALQDYLRGTGAGDLTVADNLRFKSGTAFIGTLDHAATANRTWTFPDIAGEIALLKGGSAQTLTTGQTGLNILVDDNTSAEGAQAIKLQNVNAKDRATIEWHKSDGAKVVSLHAHETNFTDSTSHNRFEIKTRNTATSAMNTHFAIEWTATDTPRAFVDQLSEFIFQDTNIVSLRRDDTTALSFKMFNRDSGGTQREILRWSGTHGGSDSSQIDFDVYVEGSVNTRAAALRYFRNTSTTGARSVTWFAGDGTATDTAVLDVSIGRFTVNENLRLKSGTGFIGTFDHAIAADRTWTFPDIAGTVALMDVNNAGNFRWLSGTSFAGTLDHANTVDRTYTFPDAAIIISGSAAALTSGRVVFATTGGLLLDDADFTFDGSRLALAVTGASGGILFGGDAGLYHGAADRIDVATGDSLGIVSGSIIFVPGANQVALSRGANDRLDLASGDSLNIVNGSILTGTDGADLGTATLRWELFGSNVKVYNAAADANPTVQLSGTTLQLGAGGATALDVSLSRGAANRLDLATGDSLRLVNGSFQFGDGSFYYSLSGAPAADRTLTLPDVAGGLVVQQLGNLDITNTPASGQILAAISTTQATWQTAGGGGLGLAPIDAPYLTIGGSGTLTAERSFVASTGLTAVDGGINSTYTLSINQAFTPTWTGLHTFTAGLTITTADLTITDRNVVLSATTGTQWGTANTEKQSWWGATPVVRHATALTQTYSTADSTHAARTAAALTDNSGGTPSDTIADAGAIYSQTNQNNFRASITDEVNKLRNDQIDSAQFLNYLVDVLQTYGFVI